VPTLPSEKPPIFAVQHLMVSHLSLWEVSPRVTKGGLSVKPLRQTMMDGKSGRGSTIVTTGLVQDMCEVIGHGFLTQP
jgi:hypothetical protein